MSAALFVVVLIGEIVDTVEGGEGSGVSVGDTGLQLTIRSNITTLCRGSIIFIFIFIFYIAFDIYA